MGYTDNIKLPEVSEEELFKQLGKIADPYLKTLVIINNRVVMLIDYGHFFRGYEWLYKTRKGKLRFESVLVSFVPLKGFLNKKDYYYLKKSWDSEQKKNEIKRIKAKFIEDGRINK